MQEIRLTKIAETDSTNAFLKGYTGEEGGRMTVVSADYQTAGRGQGTNTWESERGKNLLFSAKFRPQGVKASEQYILLEAAAVAIVEVLRRFGDGFTIKWPNDIYWHDRKVSGTLTECSLSAGMVKDCILGVGINVNQTVFTSDAPNPESLKNILNGTDIERSALLAGLLQSITLWTDKVDEGRYDEIRSAYMSKLYRSEGFHPYRDNQGEFEAEITDVLPNGHLILHRRDGSESRYAFKEVLFLIDK